LGVPVADRGGEHEIYPSNPQLREQSRTMIRHQVKTQDDVMLNAAEAGNPSGKRSCSFTASRKIGARGSRNSSRGRLSHKPTFLIHLASTAKVSDV
jgi:hypothetical protein